MAEGVFVSYCRVSTARQGRSGLGLEAQQQAVRDYLDGGGWTLVAEVIEIESGRRADRPKLAEALRLCRVHRATLVIARLCRLSRDAHFLLGLQRAGVEFVAADLPGANRLTLGIMASLAEAEGRLISERTRVALAAAKARGTQLGGDGQNLRRDGVRGREVSLRVRQEQAARRAADIIPVIDSLGDDLSLREIAAALNDRRIPAPRGGTWSSSQVKRITDLRSST